MLQKVVKFVVPFAIIVLGSYFIQIMITNRYFLNANSDVIRLSYLFNAVFTLLFISTIIFLSKKYKDQIGFIFLAGSFIKTGAFFIVLRLNEIEINKNAFLDFFIPYIICLILEVYYISKILRSIK
ncbi:DUF6168 family protein [Aquimarina mytili]|uniref:Uncharacterized protein n=1 Tax=Aquimarina mytili TaxID=874423 RepID=A0A936ZSK3_9FLAO|nr:DUF6168 family protein [Aquimarina mytili]MBL0684647.1 hypothetical protein [Aquimarina mytili]